MSATCPVCYDNFDTMESLIPHFRIHDEKWYDSCSECLFVATCEEEWVKHQEDIHDMVVCPNESCSVIAETSWKLSVHWGQKHDGKLSDINDDFDTTTSEEHIKRVSESLKESNHTPWNKGKTGVYDEETIREMNESRDMSGKNNPMYGKTHSEKTKNKISKSNSGKYSGEDNPMYGRTGEEHPYYGVTGSDHPVWKEESDADKFRSSGKWLELRKDVYKRDDYTCQNCGQRGGTIHAHHIEPVSEGGDKLDMDNLETLCKDCHYSEHEMFGYGGDE